jgi:tRNA G18 (ribose-2'-O)-methylase SpoU
MRDIILIAHDMRSCHNVGSLLRTADGLGVKEVIFSGYTPHPYYEHDARLPHEALKLTRQIHKTALGAEDSQKWSYQADVRTVISQLRAAGYRVIALEQAEDAIELPTLHPPQKVAILLGREVKGIDPEILALCDSVVEIPMFGKKESFNVIQSAAMILYHCRFTT